MNKLFLALITIMLFSLSFVTATSYVNCVTGSNTTTLYYVNTSTSNIVLMGANDVFLALTSMTPLANFTVPYFEDDFTAATNGSTVQLDLKNIVGVNNVTNTSNRSIVLGSGNYTVNATAGTILFKTNSSWTTASVTVNYNRTFVKTTDNLVSDTTILYDTTTKFYSTSYSGVMGSAFTVNLGSAASSMLDGKNWTTVWNYNANCTAVAFNYAETTSFLPSTGNHLSDFMKNIASGIGVFIFIIFLAATIAGMFTIAIAALKKGSMEK